jgi:hypothetical protein
MKHIGISLYHKVLDQIKWMENCNNLKGLQILSVETLLLFSWWFHILLIFKCVSVSLFLCYDDLVFYLHNFGHSVSFDYWIFVCGIIHCVFLLMYIVYLWYVHNMYLVKYGIIVDLHDMYITCILTFAYWLVFYLDAVSPNMDFWNKTNWIWIWKRNNVAIYQLNLMVRYRGNSDYWIYGGIRAGTESTAAKCLVPKYLNIILLVRLC